MRSNLSRALLLLAHVVGAVGWFGAVTGAVLLDIGDTLLRSPGVQVSWIDRLTGWVTYGVLLPCIAVVLLTGLELARRWGAHWPRWVVLKVWLSLGLLADGFALGLLRTVYPGYSLPLRLAGLAALSAALVLSILKPELAHRERRRTNRARGSSAQSSPFRRGRPVSGGRHRR